MGESIPDVVRMLENRIWNLHVEDIPGRKHYHMIEMTSGALLVIIGILIFTNRFTIIARTLQPYLPVY